MLWKGCILTRLLASLCGVSLEHRFQPQLILELPLPFRTQHLAEKKSPKGFSTSRRAETVSWQSPDSKFPILRKGLSKLGTTKFPSFPQSPFWPHVSKSQTLQPFSLESSSPYLVPLIYSVWERIYLSTQSQTPRPANKTDVIGGDYIYVQLRGKTTIGWFHSYVDSREMTHMNLQNIAKNKTIPKSKQSQGLCDNSGSYHWEGR